MEQTLYEATITGSTGEKRTIILLTPDNYIMGLTKPIEQRKLLSFI